MECFRFSDRYYDWRCSTLLRFEVTTLKQQIIINSYNHVSMMEMLIPSYPLLQGIWSQGPSLCDGCKRNWSQDHQGMACWLIFMFATLLLIFFWYVRIDLLDVQCTKFYVLVWRSKLASFTGRPSFPWQIGNIENVGRPRNETGQKQQ